MKKILLSLLAIAFFAVGTNARQLSYSEARTIAMEKLGVQSRTTLKSLSSQQADAPLYVFNGSDGGFVVVAGDDQFQSPILAYSMEGSFDLSDCPPVVAEWFKGMSQYVADVQSGAVSVPKSTSSLDYSNPVEPLITTKWAQGYPYYNNTPTINGTHCLTGCVATALAMIMNYWKYPQNGGLREYSTTWMNPTAMITEEFKVDFTKSRYKWDKMKDKYGKEGEETDTEACDAVAQLMFECGVATDMKWALTASGTESEYYHRALVEVLGYDQNVRMLKSDACSFDSIRANVKAELDAARPVLYAGKGYGSAVTDAHQFLCDGYDSSGLFHFNWGWGGNCNGYYSIENLDPKREDGTSIGHNFTNEQLIFVGVQPPTGKPKAYDDWLIRLSFMPAELSPDDGLKKRNGTLTFDNWSFDDFHGKIEVGLQHEGTGEITRLPDNDIMIAADDMRLKGYDAESQRKSSLEAVQSFSVDGLADGTYNVYVKLTDLQGRSKVPHSTVNSPIFTVVNGEIDCEKLTIGTPTFTLTQEKFEFLDVELYDMNISIPVSLTTSKNLEFTVKGTTTYADDVSGEQIMPGNAVNVSIAPGETKTISLMVSRPIDRPSDVKLTFMGSGQLMTTIGETSFHFEGSSGVDSVEKDEATEGSQPKFNLNGQQVGDNHQGVIVTKGKKYIKR